MATAPVRILESARDLFLEEGLSGVSMRKVAARVGLTAPAIYRHFRSKDELLSAVMAEGFRIFGTYLYDSLSGNTPEERLRSSGLGYVNFALEQPKYYEIIFVLPCAPMVETESLTHSKAGNATFQFITDRVRECMQASILKPGDPESVATAIWAHSHGLVTLYLSGRLGMEEAEFRELFFNSFDHLMQGIGNQKVNTVNLSEGAAV